MDWSDDTKRYRASKKVKPHGDGVIAEGGAKVYLGQMVLALQYLFQQHICHRDLKVRDVF